MTFHKRKLIQYAQLVDETLDKELPKPEGPASRLYEAMRYSVFAGGKRVRPYLALRACEISGGSVEQAVYASCAVECIHTYSLIHDDLPALDDDDLRRGQPTCHRKFGEATALLAGDALLTFAFELVSKAGITLEKKARVMEILACRAGQSGMVGGQMADIIGEKSEPNAELMHYIHMHKTADLITSAVLIGAVCGDADENMMRVWEEYGQNFGFAFQVTDDILDFSSTSEEMGKAVGKDADSGKQNSVVVLGYEEAVSLSKRLVCTAVDSLAFFGDRASDLTAFALWLPERRS